MPSRSEPLRLRWQVKAVSALKCNTFIQSIKRSFNISSTWITTKSRSRPTSRKHSDDDLDIKSLTSTLVDDDIDDHKETHGVDLRSRKGDDVIKQCTSASLAIQQCSGYADYLSSLHLISDNNAILAITNQLLLTFPLTHSQADLESLFLELCRFANTSERTVVKQQALRLIMIQIRSGYISVLADIFCMHGASVLTALLGDLMKCLPDCWMEIHRSDMHRSVQPVWLMDLHISTTKRTHAATPFMEFLLHLIRSRLSVARTVLDAGYINLIISMCTTGFLDPRAPGADTSRWKATSSLITLLASSLGWLARYPDLQDFMSKKWPSLVNCWPSSHYKALVDLKLKSGEFSMLSRRRSQAFCRIRYLSDLGTYNETKHLIELLHLSRRTAHDSDIVVTAIKVLIYCIRGWHETWMPLCDELMKTPYLVVSELFFDMVSCLMTSSTPVNSGSLTRIFDFVDFVSRDSGFMRTAWEEAGVEALGYESDCRRRNVAVVSDSRRNSVQYLDQNLLKG